MKEPTQCELWTRPELVSESKEARFSRIATFVEESHHWRYLLQCRECRQLYFFEFYEEVDWVDGEDPQWSTYVPVDSDEEIALLKSTAPLGLLQFFPRLQRDFPKGASAPTTRWVRIERA